MKEHFALTTKERIDSLMRCPTAINAEFVDGKRNNRKLDQSFEN